jgi:glutamyl-tRNA synthetase
MTVVTRFAPSPTGFLHIGGARTALFNWLYARGRGGKFLLRIEDTDRARSSQEAVEAIYDGLRWLGLEWDGEAVSQFARAARHAEVARGLVEAGGAYRCYASPEELEEMRRAARAANKPMRYDGRWRDRDPADAPPGVKPVIRLKAPQSGETVIRDRVQGDVVVPNDSLDDMVLLRSDGTPTYMLAVVVDDHDMGVTHVIRGDDHLTNAARQMQLYAALGWSLPEFAHIPLIHGPDGAKLSKRHGALSVQAYREMGYLPEAVCNYLMRLGWSHGDDEIISREQAIGWFDLDAVGRSPSRFDFAKLENLNGHYMREADPGRLLPPVEERLAARAGRSLQPTERERLRRLMPGFKERTKTLNQLADDAWFCVAERPLQYDERAARLLTQQAREALAELAGIFAATEWAAAPLEAALRSHAEKRGLKLGDLAQPLRAALTGRAHSPSIFDVLAALGRDESLARMRDAAGG